MLRIVSTALALLCCASTQAAHYKVFLLGGQSNMTGNATKTSDLTEAQKAPQDDVWIYGGADESVSKLGPLQPGYGSSYGPELGFGRTIADGRPYENFALIKYSKGGTNLSDSWDPTTGNIYNRFNTTVGFGLEALTKAGHTYEVVGMLWTQGERDAGNGRTTAEYEADLNELIADIRTRYGANVAFFISRLSIEQTGREPGLHDIRAAQDNVAAADPSAYLIDTDSFDMGGDNLHFTGTGIVELGNAFGQAYLNSLPVDASAPQIDTLSPEHTAPAVEPTANLSMTFDEEVVFGTGDITLYQTGGTLVESYGVAAPSTNLTLSGNTLTIDPSSLLAASTGYYIEIAATAIEDHAGNPFAEISGDGIWSFTTSAGDDSAPTLDARTPANGANNVKINQNLSITFSENIAFGTGNIELRLATGDTLVESYNVASYNVASPPANLSISGGTLTINPTSDLTPSTGYYVVIDAAAIDDHTGNSFAGLDGNGAWAFTTAAPVIDGSEITATASRTDFNSNGTARGTPDKTIDGSGLSGGEHGSATGTYCLAPTTIYNPVESQWFQWDLGASHTLGSIHVWNFDLRSVDIYFSNVAIPGGTGSGNWTRLGGTSLELPAAGAPNTGFDLASATGTTLPTTEVRYIRFEANTNWSGGNRVALSEIQFSASPAAEDETPPEIQTLSPAHTATGVALASNLSVTFNENVTFGAGAIRLRRQSDNSVIESFNVADPPTGLTRSEATVTLNPTSDLALATTYYVEIDTTAIDDFSGNSFPGFVGDGTWRFTTSVPDTTLPTISTLNPVNNATGISVDDNLVITFSENVTFGAGAIRLRRQSDDSVIESFNVADPPTGLTRSEATVTLNPTSDLALATTYYVEIDATAIDDLAGNSFAGFLGNGTWSFTTTAILQPSTVDASGFYDVTDNAVVTTDLLDWGYVSRQANNNQSGGFGSISEVNATGQDFGTLTLGGYGNLTTVSGSSSIGTVTFTEGAPTDVLSAAFTGSSGGWYSFDGNAAHGDMRGMDGNEQDVWTLTFNDLGIGQFEITVYLGVSEAQNTKVFDMDYTLFDGTTISGTSTSAAGSSYTLITSPESFRLFVYNIVVTTTTSGSDLSLKFGGVSGPNGGEILLSGYTVAAIAPSDTFTDWIGGFTGLGGLTAFGDDPDGDGNKNGVENYFGTHPGEFSQGLASGTVSGSTMTFTHPLNDSPASNLSATYRWSKDLSGFHGDDVEFEGTTVSFSPSTPADGMVTVTATVTGNALDRLFVDIEVTEN